MKTIPEKTLTNQLLPPPVPQHNKRTFESEQKFDEWLNRTHTKKIEFATELDMDTIWITNTGEILHANMQVATWIGRFVHPDYVVVGMPVLIWINGKWMEMDVVEKITSNTFKG